MKIASLDSSRQGWLYNAGAQAIWGTGSIVISLITKTLATSLLVSIRHGLGAILLGITIIAGKKQVSFKSIPWRHAIALGILAGATPDLLLVTSVRHVGPIIAVLLARLDIPLGVLFAQIFLGERVTSRAYIASLLGVVGTAFISYKPGQAITLHSGFYLGIAAGVGAGIIWGLAVVYGKYILNRKANAQALTFIRLSLGSLTALLVTCIVVSQPLHILSQLRLRDWLYVLYLGIFNSGLGYLLFYRSMELIDAHVAQILLGVSMIVTVCLGLIIGVPVTALQWLGIVTIIWSIYLIKLPKVTAEELET